MALVRDRRPFVGTPGTAADNGGPVNTPPMYDWMLGANPTINPDYGFTHPTYAGTDPAYAAWLAQADLQSANAVSGARTKRARANDAYRQALTDADVQATQGRKNLQTSMLQRGMFRSGEFGRRRSEFDAAMDAGKQRSYNALVGQIGSIDEAQQNAIDNLAMQGTTQMSQATMRDALAAYQSQQTAAAGAPAPTAAPIVAAPVTARPAAIPASSTPSYLKPSTNQAGQDPRFRVAPAPKPKVAAAGSTGSLKQTRSGLQ